MLAMQSDLTDIIRCIQLIVKGKTVNGKYYVAPPLLDSEMDFKELFRFLANVGAGRPVDTNGAPDGPWTPELLCNAISEIELNVEAVDLRSVQRWFQKIIEVSTTTTFVCSQGSLVAVKRNI